MLRAAVLSALLLSAACGDDPAAATAQLGGLTVEVFDRPAALVVRDGERVLFDGLRGAAVDESADVPRVAAAVRHADATYEFLFGSFRIEEDPFPEPWTGVATFGTPTLVEGGIVFGLLDVWGQSIGTAKVMEEGPGELSITLTAEGDVNRFSAAFACREDEHFLGFGGQSFDVDHRGQTVPIWVQEDGIQKAEDDYYNFGVWFLNGRRHSTHTPMPIYLSSSGYALALDTPYRSIFSMCSEDEDVVRVEAWESEMRMRLFAGSTPLELIEKLTGWTGRPEVPPLFAFAPWLDAIFGEENVARVAQKLRDADVAVSVIWSEDWRGGKDGDLGYRLDEDWEVDRELYPNFEDLADDLHGDGYKFFIYNNTFLDSSVPVYQEAVAGGYTIKNEDGEPYLFDGVKFEPTSLADLSNPDAVDWVKKKYRDGLELGTDGYMADYAEWLPVDAVLDSGEDPVARHNLYPVDFQRLNKELFDEMYAEDGIERLFFVRSAYLGSQPLVSVVWAGDQQTDFSEGDGYPSVIPMGIGLGVTGFPYYGHDIGGYMSRLTIPTTRELWFRWVTLGAMSPVMRTHHGNSARETWNWESDEESTAHMQRWSKLHMQLLPYLHHHAQLGSDAGVPMFRPLALSYPEFDVGWTSTDQFMLGDRLIVAPVVEEGATERTVELPAGTFYPLLGGASVSGSFTASAPVAEIPVFVPAGSVIVLLPDSVDTAVAAPAVADTVTVDDVGDDRESLGLARRRAISSRRSVACPTAGLRGPWMRSRARRSGTATLWTCRPATVSSRRR